MAKVPVAGAVKTRLAREMGAVEATRFYRHATRALIARLGHTPFWQTIIAVAPDAGVASRVWPFRVRRRAQGGGDLGRRMLRPMLELPPGPVCVIGTDIPGIEAVHVRRAFRLLGRHDVVFGPAEDGGYWLVGMRRRPHVPRPFAGVRWSSRHALADTLRNLEGQSVGYTARLGDVDCAADLKRLHRPLGRRIGLPLPPQRGAAIGL